MKNTPDQLNLTDLDSLSSIMEQVVRRRYCTRGVEINFGNFCFGGYRADNVFGNNFHWDYVVDTHRDCKVYKVNNKRINETRDIVKRFTCIIMYCQRYVYKSGYGSFI